jgi:hypothetical protein
MYLKALCISDSKATHMVLGLTLLRLKISINEFESLGETVCVLFVSNNHVKLRGPFDQLHMF